MKEEAGRSPTAEIEHSPKSVVIPRWVVVVAALVLAGVVVVIFYGYLAKPGWIGVSDKKFWDYLELLIVPAVLAIGVAWINLMQGERGRREEEAQQRRELELQDQRSQDEALQAYLDQLTQLLVTQRDHDLIRMRVDDDVRQVIQARSEPLLRSLNPTRRWSLVMFLAVMGLLAKDRPIIRLAGTNLRGVDGQNAPLEQVDLATADLAGANLQGANLKEADLAEANLFGANLQGAHLEGAHLAEAYLAGADLEGAHLERSYLRGAYLVGANLQGAHLEKAYLEEANLEGAYLRGAYLEEAYFEGAIMPNGQTYEQWIAGNEHPAYHDWGHHDFVRMSQLLDNEVQRQRGQRGQ
jgi:Pentapeptide repeats (8 copies)